MDEDADSGYADEDPTQGVSPHAPAQRRNAQAKDDGRADARAYALKSKNLVPGRPGRALCSERRPGGLIGREEARDAIRTIRLGDRGARDWKVDEGNWSTSRPAGAQAAPNERKPPRRPRARRRRPNPRRPPVGSLAPPRTPSAKLGHAGSAVSLQGGNDREDLENCR